MVKEIITYLMLRISSLAPTKQFNELITEVHKNKK